MHILIFSKINVSTIMIASLGTVISCHYRPHFMITNVRPHTVSVDYLSELSALSQWKKGIP